MTERRKFTTRERIGVITESGFSAEGLALSGSPRAMRALEELISVLCDTVLGQREQIARVREIHQPHRCRMSTRHIDCSIMFGGECSHEGKCQVCREKYPCATICALGGDSDE